MCKKNRSIARDTILMAAVLAALTLLSACSLIPGTDSGKGFPGARAALTLNISIPRTAASQTLSPAASRDLNGRFIDINTSKLTVVVQGTGMEDVTIEKNLDPTQTNVSVEIRDLTLGKRSITITAYSPVAGVNTAFSMGTNPNVQIGQGTQTITVALRPVDEVVMGAPLSVSATPQDFPSPAPLTVPVAGRAQIFKTDAQAAGAFRIRTNDDLSFDEPYTILVFDQNGKPIPTDGTPEVRDYPQLRHRSTYFHTTEANSALYLVIYDITQDYDVLIERYLRTSSPNTKQLLSSSPAPLRETEDITPIKLQFNIPVDPASFRLVSASPAPYDLLSGLPNPGPGLPTNSKYSVTADATNTTLIITPDIAGATGWNINSYLQVYKNLQFQVDDLNGNTYTATTLNGMSEYQVPVIRPVYVNASGSAPAAGSGFTAGRRTSPYHSLQAALNDTTLFVDGENDFRPVRVVYDSSGASALVQDQGLSLSNPGINYSNLKIEGGWSYNSGNGQWERDISKPSSLYLGGLGAGANGATKLVYFSGIAGLDFSGFVITRGLLNTTPSNITDVEILDCGNLKFHDNVLRPKGITIASGTATSVSFVQMAVSFTSQSASNHAYIYRNSFVGASHTFGTGGVSFTQNVLYLGPNIGNNSNLIIANNVIESGIIQDSSGGSPTIYVSGIQIASSSQPKIINNTFLMRAPYDTGATYSADVVALRSANSSIDNYPPLIVNNLFALAPVLYGATPTVQAINTSLSGSDPYFVYRNMFSGFGSTYTNLVSYSATFPTGAGGGAYEIASHPAYLARAGRSQTNFEIEGGGNTGTTGIYNAGGFVDSSGFTDYSAPSGTPVIGGLALSSGYADPGGITGSGWNLMDLTVISDLANTGFFPGPASLYVGGYIDMLAYDRRGTLRTGSGETGWSIGAYER